MCTTTGVSARVDRYRILIVDDHPIVRQGLERFVSQEPDTAKQRQLIKGAAQLSREQLRQKAKGEGTAAVKTAIARFALPTGVCLTVQGRELTLASAIEAMLEAVKELKKGQGQGLDITTAQRVMRDKAKATVRVV